jgi:hypothetical protein
MSTAISLRRKRPRAPVLSEIRDTIVAKRASGKKRISNEEREAANEGFEEYEKNDNKWMIEELNPSEAFLTFNLPRGVSKVQTLTIYERYKYLTQYRLTSFSASSLQSCWRT